MRVIVTLMCVQISPILLSGFVKVGGRGVGHGDLMKIMEQQIEGNGKGGGRKINKKLCEIIIV